MTVTTGLRGDGASRSIKRNVLGIFSEIPAQPQRAMA